jgi:hypothetical protein
MGNEDLKKRHERAVGERFISAYNQQVAKHFQLAAVRERPDLEFRDSETGEMLGVEVLTSYYGEDHARREWTDARGGRAGEELLPVAEPDRSVVEKSLKGILGKLQDPFDYPHQLFLVVDISPAVLTTVDDFRREVERLFFASRPQYRGIFVMDWKGQVHPLYEAEG